MCTDKFKQKYFGLGSPVDVAVTRGGVRIISTSSGRTTSIVIGE